LILKCGINQNCVPEVEFAKGLEKSRLNCCAGIVVAGSLTLHRWSVALTGFHPQFSSSWVSSNCYKSINECFSISIRQPISYFYYTCYILFHVHWHQKPRT